MDCDLFKKDIIFKCEHCDNFTRYERLSDAFKLYISKCHQEKTNNQKKLDKIHAKHNIYTSELLLEIQNLKDEIYFLNKKLYEKKYYKAYEEWLWTHYQL